MLYTEDISAYQIIVGDKSLKLAIEDNQLTYRVHDFLVNIDYRELHLFLCKFFYKLIKI